MKDMREARAARRAELAKQRSKRPRKIKSNTGVRSMKRIRRLRLRKAIRGSNGNIKVIAERLGVTYERVRRIVRGEVKGYEREVALFRVERERLTDHAEYRLRKLIDSRDEMVSLRATTYYLDRQARDRGYGKTTVIEGGNKPILTAQTDVPVEELPLEVRMAVLAAVEVRQRNSIDGNDDGDSARTLPG